MKRLTYIILASMLSTTMTAQTTMLWDGENQTINSRGGCWDDCAPVVVANPEKNGINTSDNCLKFTMTDNSHKTMKMPFKNWITPTLTGRQRLTMMVKKSGNCNIHIELTDESSSRQHVATWYSGNNGWQKLVFDFSGNGAIEHPKVLAISQTDDVGGSTDVYIDNVAIEEPWGNGTPLNDVAFGSLSGNITLTGLWARGECQNVNDMGNWKSVSYDDFDLLSSKLSTRTTSVDMRGASTIGAYNVFAAINPNTIIYANSLFADSNLEGGVTTENYIATPDYGNMPTYYIPSMGYVSDVMPYYDSTNKFMIAFLHEYEGSRHPYHLITSENLTTFKDEGEIIANGWNNDSDKAAQHHWLGTGCILKEDEKYYSFYTAEREGELSGYNKQEIWRAESSDGKTNWEKVCKVLSAPKGTSGNEFNENEFRDAQIYKDDEDTFHMLVTTMLYDGSHNYPAIAHFKSKSIEATEYSYEDDDINTKWVVTEKPFYVDRNRQDEKNLFECPDLFNIEGTWYLTFSDQKDKRMHYLIAKTDNLSIDNLDNGNWQDNVGENVIDGAREALYAGKTAFDGSDRYLFGWLTKAEGNGEGRWSGSLITHKLTRGRKADGNDKLYVTQPHTFENKFKDHPCSLPLLRTDGDIPKSANTYSMNAGDRLHFTRLKRANMIKLRFKNASDNAVFGFALRENNSDNDPRYSFRLNIRDNKLYYNKDAKMGSNYSGTEEINQIVLPPAENTDEYNLVIMHEQSVVVVYLNNQVALSARIYNSARNPWSIFCENGSVEVEEPKAWSY